MRLDQMPNIGLSGPGGARDPALVGPWNNVFEWLGFCICRCVIMFCFGPSPRGPHGPPHGVCKNGLPDESARIRAILQGITAGPNQCGKTKDHPSIRLIGRSNSRRATRPTRVFYTCNNLVLLASFILGFSMMCSCVSVLTNGDYFAKKTNGIIVCSRNFGLSDVFF